ALPQPRAGVEGSPRLARRPVREPRSASCLAASSLGRGPPKRRGLTNAVIRQQQEGGPWLLKRPSPVVVFVRLGQLGRRHDERPRHLLWMHRAVEEVVAGFLGGRELVRGGLVRAHNHFAIEQDVVGAW